jgi:hypothetical protein
VVCKDFLDNRSRRALKNNRGRSVLVCRKNTAACNLCKCNVKKFYCSNIVKTNKHANEQTMKLGK